MIIIDFQSHDTDCHLHEVQKGNIIPSELRFWLWCCQLFLLLSLFFMINPLTLVDGYLCELGNSYKWIFMFWGLLPCFKAAHQLWVILWWQCMIISSHNQLFFSQIMWIVILWSLNLNSWELTKLRQMKVFLAKVEAGLPAPAWLLTLTVLFVTDAVGNFRNFHNFAVMKENYLWIKLNITRKVIQGKMWWSSALSFSL